MGKIGRPGKPKNDGSLLVVRLSREAHVAIAKRQAEMIASGIRPGEATKARVVAEAVEMLYHMVMSGATDKKEVQ